MKSILFLLTLSISFSSWAASEFFKFGSVSMSMDFNKGFYITSTCLDPQKKCEAKNAMDKIDSIEVEAEDLVGGKNPFSIKCSKHLGGVVLVGVDKSGNELAFCKFKDGTMFR